MDVKYNYRGISMNSHLFITKSCREIEAVVKKKANPKDIWRKGDRAEQKISHELCNCFCTLQIDPRLFQTTEITQLGA